MKGTKGRFSSFICSFEYQRPTCAFCLPGMLECQMRWWTDDGMFRKDRDISCRGDGHSEMHPMFVEGRRRISSKSCCKFDCGAWTANTVVDPFDMERFLRQFVMNFSERDKMVKEKQSHSLAHCPIHSQHAPNNSAHRQLQQKSQHRSSPVLHF